jgi:hypothetical protein
MRLESRPACGEDIVLQVLLGMALLAIVGLVIGGIAEAIHSFGVRILYALFIIPIGAAAWVVGHVFLSVHKVVIQCEGCYQEVTPNIFAEYWHKRSCLPFIAKQV